MTKKLYGQQKEKIKEHIFLCNCEGCKGRHKDKLFLKIKETGKDKFIAQIKGEIFSSTKITITKKDLKDFLREISN